MKTVIWTFKNLISLRIKDEIPQNKEQYFVSQVRKKSSLFLLYNSQNKKAFKILKQQILNFESLLLRTLAFDLNVTHPYGTLLKNLGALYPENKNFAQVSWNFINDSLQRTNLCLQFKPELIAAASIYLASKITNTNIPDKENKKWYEYLNVPLPILIEISDQIYELYGNETHNLRNVKAENSPQGDKSPNNTTEAPSNKEN